MKAKRRYAGYFLIYTLLFAVVFLCVFSPYLREGKSLIGGGDGQSQYILQLRYMGEWLRKTFQGFIHGDFMTDRFDYTIGMGDDIDAVVRFHPLDFLSVFVPGDHTELLYNVLIVLRCYLAGLSLSAYVFHFRRGNLEALSGALVYVFCGFTFGLGVVHPTYMSHMILFPLMMLGAEYMMDPERKHSPVLLIVTVALGFISNYYFMYISSFGLLVYVLIRFFDLYREERLKNFLRLLTGMSLAYLVGLAISGIFLIPALMRFGSSMRAGHETERKSLIYYEDKRRYAAWFLNLITPLEASGNGTHLNFSVTLFPALAVILSGARRRKVFRQMRAGLLALLLCLLIPGLGFILAAMNNENNRWVYLIAFAAAISVSFTADMMADLEKKEKTLILASTVLFDAGCAAWYFISKEAVYHLAAAVQLTVLTAVLLLLNRRRTGAAGRQSAAILSGKTVLVFTTVSVLIGGYMTFSPRFGNLVRYYEDRGTSLDAYRNSVYSVYTKVPGYRQEGQPFAERFYRVDGVKSVTHEDNTSLLLRYPGVQIYNSIVNADVLSMMIRGQNIGLTSILHVQSLDGRTIPEELAGVRYFAADEKNLSSVPYGYSGNVIAKKDGYALYSNENPLSFGYTVDTVLPQDEAGRLSPAAADLSMLEAASVDEPADMPDEEKSLLGRLRTAEADSFEGQIRKEDLTPSGSSNITAGGDTMTTGEQAGLLQIPYVKKAGYETYLSLEGMKAEGKDGAAVTVAVGASGIRKRILLSTVTSSYGRGSDDYTVGLGHTEDGTDQKDNIVIRIPAYTKLSVSRIFVSYLPLAGYEEKIEKLNDSSLGDVIFSGDTVTGTASLKEPEFMVFQIPYSSGWSAEVNGKKSAILKADGCYMGLPLDSGVSQIRLVYRTPGLAAGHILTLAGLILLAALQIVFSRRTKLRAHASGVKAAGLTFKGGCNNL